MQAGASIQITASDILGQLRHHPNASSRAIKKAMQQPDATLSATFIMPGLTSQSIWIRLEKGGGIGLTKPVSIRVTATSGTTANLYTSITSGSASPAPSQGDNLPISTKPLPSQTSYQTAPEKAATNTRLSPDNAMALLKREFNCPKFYKRLHAYAKRVVAVSLKKHSLGHRFQDYYTRDEFAIEAISRAYIKVQNTFSNIGYDNSKGTTMPYLKIALQTVAGDIIEQEARMFNANQGTPTEYHMALPKPEPFQGRILGDVDSLQASMRQTLNLTGPTDEEHERELLLNNLERVCHIALQDCPLPADRIELFKAHIWGGVSITELSELHGLSRLQIQSRIATVSRWLKETLGHG